jgi:MraZ protein
MGGCLAIYRKSDITEIVERFKKKQHIAKFQKFFTLFFSTLVETTCDKVGRIMIPSVLKNGVGMKHEVIIAGALNKIELWPKEVYEKDLLKFIDGETDGDLQKMMEEAFSLLSEDEEENRLETAIERVQNEVVKL